MHTNNNESFGLLSKKLARYYEVEMACIKSYLPKNSKYYISLSDEEDLVMAVVIIEV